MESFSLQTLCVEPEQEWAARFETQRGADLQARPRMRVVISLFPPDIFSDHHSGGKTAF